MTDHFEEKVVNRVLSWRMKPDGVWNPYSAEQLTSKIVEASIAVQEALNPVDYKLLQEGVHKIFIETMQEYGYSNLKKDDKNGA